MGKSKIEWCTDVWNVITGCTHSGSPGCDHCYAARMVKRFPQLHGLNPEYTINRQPLPFDRIQFHPSRLDQPLRWKKPRRIFVCSMGDLFHTYIWYEEIAQVMDVIYRASQHTFMVLTKRPERMQHYFLSDRSNRIGPVDSYPPKNLWLGVTAENQEMADKRIPILLQTPAANRFVSVEPMLGPVDLTQIVTGDREAFDGPSTLDSLAGTEWGALAGCTNTGFNRLDWVICGSESGPGRRPCDIEWVRSLRDQCVAAGVPFFLKQMSVNGKLIKMPPLDGKQWAQFPNIPREEIR